MSHNPPLSPRFPRPLTEGDRCVRSMAQLRSQGFSAAELSRRCRPGGGWQQLLPGVFLLRPGSPTGEERLRAVLMYAARRAAGGKVPSQPGPEARDRRPPVSADAVLTGAAALALHGFACVPPPESLDRIDVLVPRQRRLRSAGCARVIRTADLPEPRQITGLPVAPVPRALADAVAALRDAGAVRLLLAEAVRGGHCEPAAVVEALTAAKLLDRPHVVGAVEALQAESRALAEERLYGMVRAYRLPAPVWNVDLRLPGGPALGALDAYWPDEAVALELDTRPPHREDDAPWPEYARKRERLERLGITVVRVTPRRLREAPEQQAAVVRTALMAAPDRPPAARVVLLPR
ncbi:hypothetical protein [Streptomyces sp. NPDC047000]|uniref:hypothetical protein n=1 Tax=Streptomyces sp. NPDC047000 TaxID=3155474 RepID=UPI00340753B3